MNITDFAEGDRIEFLVWTKPDKWHPGCVVRIHNEGRTDNIGDYLTVLSDTGYHYTRCPGDVRKLNIEANNEHQHSTHPDR